MRMVSRRLLYNLQRSGHHDYEELHPLVAAAHARSRAKQRSTSACYQAFGGVLRRPSARLGLVLARLADLTAPAAYSLLSAAEPSATTDYTAPRAWAQALRHAGFDGTRYHVRHDPRSMLTGTALFGRAGRAKNAPRGRSYELPPLPSSCRSTLGHPGRRPSPARALKARGARVTRSSPSRCHSAAKMTGGRTCPASGPGPSDTFASSMPTAVAGRHQADRGPRFVAASGGCGGDPRTPYTAPLLRAVKPEKAVLRRPWLRAAPRPSWPGQLDSPRGAVGGAQPTEDGALGRLLRPHGEPEGRSWRRVSRRARANKREAKPAEPPFPYRSSSAHGPTFFFRLWGSKVCTKP